MTDVEITAEDVDGRTRSETAAQTDPDLAARIAAGIRHPWYRCQALSTAAEAHPSRKVKLRLLDQALEAAHEQGEPNRIVTVASWPLKTLAGLDLSLAVATTERLLQTIAHEPHSLRRLDALCALLALCAEHVPIRALLLRPIIEAAAAGHGWRTQRKAAFAAIEMAPYDSDAARRILDTQPFNKFKIRALERIFG